MPRSEAEVQIAVLAPTGRDCELILSMLAANALKGLEMLTVEALGVELERGLGAAIVTEEALSKEGIAHLEKALERQPPWSDFPFVVLTSPRVLGMMRQ